MKESKKCQRKRVKREQGHGIVDHVCVEKEGTACSCTWGDNNSVQHLFWHVSQHWHFTRPKYNQSSWGWTLWVCLVSDQWYLPSLYLNSSSWSVKALFFLRSIHPWNDVLKYLQQKWEVLDSLCFVAGLLFLQVLVPTLLCADSLHSAISILNWCKYEFTEG